MRQPGTAVDPGSIAWLNGLDVDRAVEELRTCCAAEAWLATVVGSRPFDSRASLLRTSDAAVEALDDEALADALSAHARIGERREGKSREAGWSRSEQAAAIDAGEDVRALLAQGNREYENRFGRIFLIRAAGRTPEEMYAALRSRLANEPEVERGVVLQELAEIVRLRLELLVTR